MPKTSSVFSGDLAFHIGSLFELFGEFYAIFFQGRLISSSEELMEDFSKKSLPLSALDVWIREKQEEVVLISSDLENDFFVWGCSGAKALGFVKGVLELVRKAQRENFQPFPEQQIQTTFNQIYQSFAVNIADEFLFSYLLNLMINLVHAEVGALEVFREKETSFFSMGFRKETIASLSYRGKSVFDFLRKSKSILFIGDTLEDSDFRYESGEHGYLKSLIFVPVIQKGNLVAIFYLVNKASSEKNSRFSFSDLQTVQTVWVQVGSVIANAILYQTTMEIKEFNEEILENIPAGILTVNVNDEILFINQYLRDFLVKNKMKIKELLDFMKSEKLPTYHNREFVLDESRTLIVNVSKRFLQIVKGGVFLYILSDISVQKQMEQQLVRTEKLAVAGELMSGLAHEIKNPLTSMKGFADLLEHRQDDPEFIKKFSKIVSTEIHRLNHLLEKLLSFVRPNLGLTTDVNLKQVLDQVVEILKFNAQKSGITIQNEVDKPVLVSGNFELLTQVFMNFILNSIQALKEVDKKEKMIYIKSFQKEKKVEIVIEDNGPGIPKDKIKNIFNPFYTTKAKGTGLGLSISHRLVTEHRGEIRVESEEGKWTKMYIVLPLSQRRLHKVYREE